MNTSNRGFIKSIVAVVIVLLIAAYFGFDLQEVLTREQAKNLVLSAWEKYIEPVIMFVWAVGKWLVVKAQELIQWSP